MVIACPFVIIVREERNYGAPPRDGPGRGRGGRGGKTGPRRDFGDADAHGFEGGMVAAAAVLGTVELLAVKMVRVGRQRGAVGPASLIVEAGNEFGRPRRAYERHSGTGRGYGMKREGAGRGNWGTATDEGLEQLRLSLFSLQYVSFDLLVCVAYRDTVDAVNPEETTAMVEDEKKPEDAPQSEVEKDKEGAENEEEEKEHEDKRKNDALINPEPAYLLELSWDVFLHQNKVVCGMMFAPTMTQEMTLEEYEKVLEEKRKAVLSLKAKERKVEIDKELQAMQQLSVKKDGDEVFIKLGSDKDLKKKESAEREERGKKDLLRALAEVLGKGSYGTTYKAVLEDGTTVVVKRLKEVVAGKREFEQQVELISKVCQHQNTVPLRPYYYSKDEKLLVYDYVPLGSLCVALHD
ncbi:Hyaluronan / mRNA binding family [Zea mays]|uniref:Hyaluronan / mRNA binding family n=1 Tax=Zea mays TaxID=4577 RepID=A0A1D6MWS2_MAIZE|nr:Hyaluronan / mRNA binding family [Zea mays]